MGGKDIYGVAGTLRRAQQGLVIFKPWLPGIERNELKFFDKRFGYYRKD